MLIDDSYNANPDSMLAAVRLLSQYPQKKIFVAGDMGELGAQSPQFHKELGEVVRNAGIAHKGTEKVPVTLTQLKSLKKDYARRLSKNPAWFSLRRRTL